MSEPVSFESTRRNRRFRNVFQAVQRSRQGCANLESVQRLPEGLVDGRYRLVGELGRGGMGAVYRAREEATGREVAIKLLPSGYLQPRQRERFVREGRASAALVHPGLVRVHASGEWEDRPFLVYELVAGARTLDESFGGCNLQGRVELVLQAARALGFAHERGVIHRDVKPGNILVDGEGRARVTDFGLALTAGDDRLTKTGELVGTPSYMAPEQLSGHVGGETPATDVWALGVILYEALTGELPFEGSNIFELAGAVNAGDPTRPRRRSKLISRGLEAVCMRALRRDPAQRYPDGGAFAAALASPEGEVSRLGPGRSVVLLALSLTACAVFGAVFFGAGEGPRSGPPLGRNDGSPVATASGAKAPRPSAQELLGQEPSAAQLEALESWLGSAAADDPARAEVELRCRHLRYDLPLARATGLGPLGGAVFVDEDTLCLATEPPSLWRVEGAALVRVGLLENLKPRESVDVLARTGSPLCDVVMHVRGEPSRILRERNLEEVFQQTAEALRFFPGRDVAMAAQVGRRSDTPRRRAGAVSRGVGEDTLFGLLLGSPGRARRVQLVKHRRGGAVEEVWSTDIADRELCGMTLSSTGSYLAVCLNEPGELQLVNTRTGELRREPLGNTPTNAVFSADERWLAVGTAGELVFLFDLRETGNPRFLQRAERGPYDTVKATSHATTVRDVAFTPDGRTLISCACRVSEAPHDSELRCWDVESGRDLAEWFRRDFPRGPFWLAVSPSGRRLALGGRVGWLEVRRFTPAER